MCVLHHDRQNTAIVLGKATWTRAAALNLCLTHVWLFCGLLYSWHVKDIMKKKMKLKGKIYKHTLPALRLSVPKDFNLKWISVSQIPCTCTHWGLLFGYQWELLSNYVNLTIGRDKHLFDSVDWGGGFAKCEAVTDEKGLETQRKDKDISGKYGRMNVLSAL